MKTLYSVINAINSLLQEWLTSGCRKQESENKKFTPKGEGGSGRQASATENT